MGEGIPRLIIYNKCAELESSMLSAKFQDHRTFGSDEDLKSYHI